MPIGRGYRNNPYSRTPLSDNPYLASVMQGIDMTVALAREQQELARQREQQQAANEREDTQKRTSRKFGLLSDIVGSKDATPETRTSASDMFFKMIEDPDMDISSLDPKFKGEEPEGQEKTYPVSKRVNRFFEQTKGKEYSFDVAKMFETQAVELEKAYIPKDKGGGGLMFSFGGRKLPAKPRLDSLADKKKRAVNIMRSGIQAEGGGGYKIGKSEAMMSQYIQAIEDLESKLREDTWDDEAEAIYQALQSPEQHGVNTEKRTGDFNAFRDSQLKFQQSMDEITGE